jgi:mycofactocin precursor
MAPTATDTEIVDTNEQIADAAPVDAASDELVADELLVEEISIDGMCGVY